MAIEGFARVGARIAAAAARDLISGGTFEVRAHRFINATGPWLDDLRRMDEAAAAPGVRLTKGVHLVISATRLPVSNSIVLSDSAERIVFLMPRDGWVTIGTTDTDFGGDRANLHADDADIGYLLDIVNAAVPPAGLSADDVAYSFAGLRALEMGDGSRAPSAVSREEIVFESASGLLSIAGGKLTTHRAIAQKIIDEVMRGLGRPAGRCPTLTTPLPGARGSFEIATDDPIISRDVAAILASRYGARAAQVTALAHHRPELAAPIVPGAPAIQAEVVYAIRAELASSVSDFLVRRTSMVWRDPVSAVAAAPEVARLMGAELGWDRGRTGGEIDHFVRTQALRAMTANRGAGTIAQYPPDTIQRGTRASGASKRGAQADTRGSKGRREDL